MTRPPRAYFDRAARPTASGPRRTAMRRVAARPSCLALLCVAALLQGGLSTDWSVSYLDLTLTQTDLAGFKGGFTDGNYGYLVPNANDAGMSGMVARFSLGDFSTVEVLDLTAVDADLQGFEGGFSDGSHGYLVPNFNGAADSGKVARISFAVFGAGSVDFLDLAATDMALTGFVRGFSDGVHGFALPGRNSKIARFSLLDFATFDSLDLTATDTRYTGGFAGGFSDGTYGYLVPSIHALDYFGDIVRFDLQDFSTVDVLDLTLTDADLKGFEGGFIDGTHGYVVPCYNGAASFGKVARFKLDGFGSVEVLDLASTDADLAGFVGGFADATHGYVVPNVNSIGYSGKLARFSLDDFSTVDVLDLTLTHADLTGFCGGFTDGFHGYALPWVYAGGTSGKVARFSVLTTTSTTATRTNTKTSSTTRSTTSATTTSTTSTTATRTNTNTSSTTISTTSATTTSTSITSTSMSTTTTTTTTTTTSSTTSTSTSTSTTKTSTTTMSSSTSSTSSTSTASTTSTTSSTNTTSTSTTSSTSSTNTTSRTSTTTATSTHGLESATENPTVSKTGSLRGSTSGAPASPRRRRPLVCIKVPRRLADKWGAEPCPEA